MNKYSYTAADLDLPLKILHDTELVNEIVHNKHIPLRHLQLCLTNKCQLSCQFCSCGDRKVVELNLIDASLLVRKAKHLGCRGITITGGGEPLLYPSINELIEEFQKAGMKVGLVTNGLALDKLKVSPTWVRVSFDSDRKFKSISGLLSNAQKRLKTDWAFSFVLHGTLGELKKLVNYANSSKFTHIRVVADILSPDDSLINEAKNALRDNDSRVVYQYRSKPTKGSKKCLISLLKPTIGADGNIYPCCGAQYAIKDLDTRDFPSRMSMGQDLLDLSLKQHYFDGSGCDVCYYSNYNKLLDLLLTDIKHKEFV